MPRADEPGDIDAGDGPTNPRRKASGEDPHAVPDPSAPDPLAPDPAVPAPTAPRGSTTPGWDDPDRSGAGGGKDGPPDRRSRRRARRDVRGTDSPAQPGDVGGEPAREPVPLTQQVGRVAIVVLAILFGVFAVVNSQSVDFSWVFGETHVRPDPAGDGDIGGVPLIVLLVAAFVVGALLGALLQWNAARSRRARERSRRW